MKWSLSRSRRVALFAVGVGGVLLAGCQRHEAQQEPLRSVKVMVVGASAQSSEAPYSGDIRARVESRLGFRVAGKLTQRMVDVGQRVAAGQVLAQLDPQDYQLALDAANAAVQAAQSQRDLAQADFKRFEALKAQGFISAAELERRQTGLQAAESALRQAQSQQAAQRNQSAYTRLQATASGVITGVDAEVGQVLGAGQPVVRLAHDGPRDAVFAVPEQAVGQVKPGQAVGVVWLATGRAVQGKVREVAAAADPVTRTFAVKVALAPGDDLPLGASVNVLLPTVHAAASGIRLPTSALRQEGQGTAVWVLEPAGMTVQSRPVTVQGVDGQDVMVSSGLNPGDRVVTAGVHVLSAGQKVAVYAPASGAQ